MKKRTWKNGLRNLLAVVAVLAAAFLMSTPMAAIAQEDYEPGEEYEYEPSGGLHEEEWYDPSDWFDTDEGISFEQDWYGYTYNEPYVDDWEEGEYRGYYEEEDLGVYDEDEVDYDYYTDDWWEGDNDLYY